MKHYSEDLALYNWQHEIIEAALVKGSQTTVVACNESGVTSVLIPRIAMAHAELYPGSQVIIYSHVKRQQMCQGIPSFANYVGKKCKKSFVKFSLPSVDGLPCSEVVYVSFCERDLLEGFHSRIYQDENGIERYCPCMVIVDDAENLRNDVHESIERINPISLIYFGHVMDSDSVFKDTHLRKNLVKFWNRFSIGWDRCKHLQNGPPYENKLRLLTERGCNDLLVKSLLLAEF